MTARKRRKAAPRAVSVLVANGSAIDAANTELDLYDRIGGPEDMFDDESVRTYVRADILDRALREIHLSASVLESCGREKYAAKARAELDRIRKLVSDE